MKYIWKTKKGEELDVDTIENIYHLRNIVKMLMRDSNTMHKRIVELSQKLEIANAKEWFLENTLEAMPDGPEDDDLMNYNFES